MDALIIIIVAAALQEKKRNLSNYSTNKGGKKTTIYDKMTMKILGLNCSISYYCSSMLSFSHIKKEIQL
jgi:hypothetical protein